MLPTPELTRLGPNSDILHDMFISGTGGFAPIGGALHTPLLVKSEENFVIPPLTKAGPDSDILHDMFIEGTGGFAPNGGLLP